MNKIYISIKYEEYKTSVVSIFTLYLKHKKIIFKYQSWLTGLPPQQPRLEGARRIYCMLPRQRGMLLRHGSLSEPWQRDLPPCFLTFRYYPRVVRHDHDERLLLSTQDEHARLPKALGSLLIFFTLIIRSFFLLTWRFAICAGFSGRWSVTETKAVAIFSSTAGEDTG